MSINEPYDRINIQIPRQHHLALRNHGNVNGRTLPAEIRLAISAWIDTFGSRPNPTSGKIGKSAPKDPDPPFADPGPRIGTKPAAHASHNFKLVGNGPVKRCTECEAVLGSQIGSYPCQSA